MSKSRTHAPTCREADQTQAGQHHGVGLGFRNRQGRDGLAMHQLSYNDAISVSFVVNMRRAPHAEVQA